jgi:nucleoside-diphosphate-sugar epimerase
MSGLEGHDSIEMLRRIEWIEADILDEFSLEAALEGVDMIYHAAAMVSYNKRDKEQMLLNNVQGTANLVNAALEAGISRIAYVSSVAALAKKNSGITTEEDKIEDREFDNTYAESKYRAEMEIWRGHTEGLKATVINPSVILGVGDYTKGSLAIIKTIAKGFPFYPAGSAGYVDVRDVSKALIELSKHEDAYGQRFIASAVNIPFKKLFEMIAREAGVKPPIIKTGKFLNFAAVMGAALQAGLTGKKPFITRDIARSSSRRVSYSSGKLKEFLNYEFIPFEQTIKDAVHGFMNSR